MSQLAIESMHTPQDLSTRRCHQAGPFQSCCRGPCHSERSEESYPRHKSPSLRSGRQEGPLQSHCLNYDSLDFKISLIGPISCSSFNPVNQDRTYAVESRSLSLRERVRACPELAEGGEGENLQLRNSYPESDNRPSQFRQLRRILLRTLVLLRYHHLRQSKATLRGRKPVAMNPVAKNLLTRSRQYRCHENPSPAGTAENGTLWQRKQLFYPRCPTGSSNAKTGRSPEIHPIMPIP